MTGDGGALGDEAAIASVQRSPRASRGRMKKLVPVVAALVLGALVVVGLVAKNRAQSRALGDLHGVRLGMTVRDVRARFDAVGVGQWESTVTDDMILKWRPGPDARSDPSSAQFEFHMGLLMAIRADLPPGDAAATGSPFELSDSAVVTREPTPNGLVHLTAIARSCPIHAKEADALVHAHR